jgi:uncharacterized surface protein with fasciclin (FAS1) repeats
LSGESFAERGIRIDQIGSGKRDRAALKCRSRRWMMKLARTLALAALAAVIAIPAQAQTHMTSQTDRDIVETAIEAGQFGTLVAAVQAADLVEVLQSDGPFTVFAPTDEAFAKLPEGTVAELLKPENKDKLIAILTYHVVPGKVLASDVVKLSSAETVQGSSVTIETRDGKVWIDNAQVIAADVEASNGVIHVIDTVILPKD